MFRRACVSLKWDQLILWFIRLDLFVFPIYEVMGLPLELLVVLLGWLLFAIAGRVDLILSHIGLEHTSKLLKVEIFIFVFVQEID